MNAQLRISLLIARIFPPATTEVHPNFNQPRCAPPSSPTLIGGLLLLAAVLASALLLSSHNSYAALTISITSPADGATYAAPASFTLEATRGSADDLDFVDFFYCAGDSQPIRLGRDRTASSAGAYTVPVTNLGAGAYTFYAQATNTGGASAESARVTITVTGDRSPTVKLLSPASNRIFEAPASISLTAAANANDYGSVTRVEYYNGSQDNLGAKICESSAASSDYTCTWNGVGANKEYVLRARVITSRGNTTATSPPAFITVTPPASTIQIKDATTSYTYPPFGAGGVGSYYVDGDGASDNIIGDDNTGDGSEARPWFSLAKALAAAPAGSTIVLRAGTYRGASNGGSLTKRLTIQPYRHEKVWFKGSEIVTGWQWDAALGLWYKDWPRQFRPPSNEVDSVFVDFAVNPLASLRDMVFIDGRPLAQVANFAACSFTPQDCGGGVVKPGTFCLDYGADKAGASDNRLYIKDDPDNRTVEATAQTIGLTVIRNPSAPDASDSVIRGLGFAHYADAAIYVGSPGNRAGALRVAVEDSTFVWNAVQGLRMVGAGNATVNPDTERLGTILRGNTFSYNGRGGVTGARPHNLLLENNLISYNNIERFRREWSANGTKLTNADEMVIRGNTVEDNLAHGVWLDVSVTDATIVHNTVRRNQANGIFFEVSSRAIIASNLVVDDNIATSNSSHALIYNNTVVNGNISIKDSNRVTEKTGAERDAELAAGIDWEARGVRIKNNILSNGNGQLLEVLHNSCGSVGPPCNDTESMIEALDDNSYYRADTTQPSTLIRWKPVGNAGPASGVAFASLSAFKGAAGGFEGQGEEYSGPVNPFFRNEATGDYRLKTDSPAKGAGEPLPSDVADAIGVEANTPVDRGALNLRVPPQDVSSQVRVTRSGFRRVSATGRYIQTVTITNTSDAILYGPFALVLADLSGNAALYNRTGTTLYAPPAGSPYVDFGAGGDGLRPSEAVRVTLEFTNPTNQPISYTTRVLAGAGRR